MSSVELARLGREGHIEFLEHEKSDLPPMLGVLLILGLFAVLFFIPALLLAWGLVRMFG
jgi:hypothetical protein